MSAPTESVLLEELQRLAADLAKEVEDPRNRAALIAMAHDLTLLPLRKLRGEDTSSIEASLKAEALNRSLEIRTRAETLAQRAWISAISRFILGSITGALT